MNRNVTLPDGSQAPLPDVRMNLTVNMTVLYNGRETPPGEVIGALMVERDFWKTRSERFESKLADTLSGETDDDKSDEL